ncbi:MAG: phosphodiester glycosidase family protein [Propionicimonas sp.]|nr:phosphodiester glycosidase family protein [Propionicimonas sp.]
MATRHRRLRTWVVSACVVVVTLAGTATTWALDRFVIAHVEIADVSQYEAEQSGTDDTSEGTGTGALTDTAYTSDDAAITVTTVTTGSGDDTLTYYVADVVVSDATTLRSAFANNQYGENITQKTSEIAADHDAVLAINGDYYGFRDTGIVIRNGVVYRDEPARTGLAFYRDGTVRLYDETTTSAQQLIDDGVWNTVSFGPALVADGAAVAGIDEVEVDTNFGNHSIQGEQPRTAIGVVAPNHYVLVVVDGREDGYSRGATLPELARIMLDLGATTAYNLDGGGSSTLYFAGEVVNQPSNGGERATSDILYVAG